MRELLWCLKVSRFVVFLYQNLRYRKQFVWFLKTKCNFTWAKSLITSGSMTIGNQKDMTKKKKKYFFPIIYYVMYMFFIYQVKHQQSLLLPSPWQLSKLCPLVGATWCGWKLWKEALILSSKRQKHFLVHSFITPYIIRHAIIHSIMSSKLRFSLVWLIIILQHWQMYSLTMISQFNTQHCEIINYRQYFSHCIVGIL